MSFAHLHVHTQYSILDGLSSIPALFNRAEELGMNALAITDHGNMYGVKEFMKFAGKHPNIKPIIGCEVYVTRHYDHTLKDNLHRGYYHLILLAKNYDGYKNLMKIVSTGHVEGLYYGKPRVSHEVLEKYHEHLVCLSACIAGEIPRDIISGNIDAAREAIQWHKNIFGEDYYLEVQLHQTELTGLEPEVYDDINGVAQRQRIANSAIFDLAEEMGVKVVATNDVHFVMKEDGPAHDRLICLTTNALITDTKRIRYTQQEYLKSEEEMRELFPRHPEVIDNTMEVVDKIDRYKIDRGHVLPKYEIDKEFLKDIDTYLEKYKDIIDAGRCDKEGNYRGDEFCNSVAYLCHLTYKGAKIRYGDTLNDEQADRIDFELKTISRMGFPDYFLIVQDYISACRKMGSFVGPGRGSAAGSVVAYCLWITNLDPIKYDLLFERFLNPDRISMPDIDVDFEDLGKAHAYVEEKYSKSHVSRVITFGTMAAKSAIKDVARISNLSIEESNRLSKMVPDRLSERVEKEYPFNPKLDELKSGFKAIEKDVEVDDPDNPGQKKTVKKWFQKGMEEVDIKNITLKDCFRLVPEFKNELANGTEENKEVLYYASKLEGSIRQTGVHACATIIGRGDLTEYIPLCFAKDKETGEENLLTSQYDGHYIEDVGMLKMDFLGLNTLTIIHKCLDLIKARYGKDIDIEAIPIDDKETYDKIYSRGDTVSVFQFESPGMMKHLQNLHPERFEDLIAMNALYRPGPMDYIPSFIARKLGQEPIEYDLPEMEKYLAETYGVTVYQEQVMLLSRLLANFTKGEADKLRKAMGKKQIAVMQELKEKFMTQGMANGHPEKTLDKIWKDWEKFAQYAFNKSHATCYAWVSYQTGWLKCHYPAEFQAANLSCNLGKSDEIKKIMADCKKSHITVLNPDINESGNEFTVNKDGNIRFGLCGIKGFGNNVVADILKEREENGRFVDIYDFAERMSCKINRKSFEILMFCGAFDSFGIKRRQFVLPCKNGSTFLDNISSYGDSYRKLQEDSAFSLFGGMEESMAPRPDVPVATQDESDIEFLHKEKELLTMYLSAHPLDTYAFELDNFTTPDVNMSTLDTLVLKYKEIQVKEFQATKRTGKSPVISIGGFVTSFKENMTKGGKVYGTFVLEDFDGSHEFRLAGKAYEKFAGIVKDGACILMEGTIGPKFFLRPDDDPTTMDWVFLPDNIMMLANVSEGFLKEFHIHVNVQALSPKVREGLVKILKKHKGKTPMTVFVVDPTTRYQVELNSRKYSVNVSNELLDALKEISIGYSITKK